MDGGSPDEGPDSGVQTPQNIKSFLPGSLADVIEDSENSEDEDVVPMSAPKRGGARPTRAAKAAAATRSRRGAAADTPDEFEFDEHSDDDDDDDVVEDSGDDAEIATTNRRGAKRKAPAAAKKKSPAKKPKKSPAKKSPAKPPPGRARASRVIEIDDSGDEDDEEVPATARGRASRSRGGTQASRGSRR